MAKAGERSYFGAIGEDGQHHSLHKPFSDVGCDQMLVGMGVLFHLLPRPPARILDLGCGTGWTSLFFARRGYEVVGQDISEEAIDLARGFAAGRPGAERLSFVTGDYEQRDQAEAFDAAVFYDSLHHAEDEKAAITCAYRALKPGGMLITHEPGEGHATSPGSLAAMERYGVTEKDMPPRLIIAHAKAIGFREARIYPMPEDVLGAHYPARRMNHIARTRKTGRIADLVRRYRLARNERLYDLTHPEGWRGGVVVLVK